MGKRQNKVRFYLITSLSIFFLPFCHSLQSPLFLGQTITSLFFCTVSVRHTLGWHRFSWIASLEEVKKPDFSVYACFVTADTPIRASGCSTLGVKQHSHLKCVKLSFSEIVTQVRAHVCVSCGWHYRPSCRPRIIFNTSSETSRFQYCNLCGVDVVFKPGRPQL